MFGRNPNPFSELIHLCSEGVFRMKNRERSGNRNMFLAQKTCRFKRAGTIHRNGVNPIDCKVFRLSCSHVPTLPYILNKKDIRGCGHAKRLYARVKGFIGVENKYGRPA